MALKKLNHQKLFVFPEWPIYQRWPGLNFTLDGLEFDPFYDVRLHWRMIEANQAK